jgi:hypothetical protein
MALLNTIALSLILISWLVQGFRVVVKKSTHLNLDFVIIYFLGSGALAVDLFLKGNMLGFGFNVAIAIIALVVGIEAFLKIK